MLKKLFIPFFIVYLMVFSALNYAQPSLSTIHTIKTMTEVKKYIDKQTLIIFDLDHTIFEGKNYGYGHANWFYDQIEKAKTKGINEKVTIFHLFPHWLVSQKDPQVTVKPVEALTPRLIKKIQAKGNLVLGLTARQVPLADITLQQLKTIQVDFTPSQLSDDIIHGFDAATLMKDGVIFCSEYNDKGEVLRAYLDKRGMIPKKIVIIDDSARHLHAVTKAYPDITVIGLHYPLVAEFKKKNWNVESAQQAYCDASKKHPKLQDYTIDCVAA